jgi:hypothetical protein
VSGDLGRRGVLRCSGENVPFPLRQRAEAVGDRRGGQAGIDDTAAGVHLADRLGELLGRRVLEQESPGAALDRSAQIAGSTEGRQHQRARRRSFAGELGSRPDTVLARHLDVEQRDVNLMRACRAEDLVPAPDLGDDLDVVFEREQAGECTPHHALVLGDENADHVVSSGTVSRTR